MSNYPDRPKRNVSPRPRPKATEPSLDDLPGGEEHTRWVASPLKQEVEDDWELPKYDPGASRNRRRNNGGNQAPKADLGMKSGQPEVTGSVKTPRKRSANPENTAGRRGSSNRRRRRESPAERSIPAERPTPEAAPTEAVDLGASPRRRTDSVPTPEPMPSRGRRRPPTPEPMPARRRREVPDDEVPLESAGPGYSPGASRPPPPAPK